jgi:spermidine/putrescine transport system substrate-binding protein
MWGTMGFMYNPENVDEEDIKSWSILWDEEYKYKATLKDAVRDTYVAAAMYVFKDELKALNEQYKAGLIDANEYSSLVSGYMNSTTDESIEKIENALNQAKKNAYGFEVDSGKSDIVTGKIDINFCWSGDAVYALDCAEEESDMYLNYYVPEEGSNVWFDGWVMPKGANKDLAQEFVNFLCDPQIAVQNMDYIGYTSAIAGQDIFDLVVDWYGVKTRDYYSDEEWEELTEEEKEEVFEDQEALLEAYENEEIYKVDLSYLFEGTIDGEAVVYTYELNRQFSAQYPSYETIIRCAVMEDFGKDNEKVISMWIRVKSDEVPVWIWVFLGTSIVLVAAYFISKTASKKIRNDRIKEKRKLEKLAAKQK